MVRLFAKIYDAIAIIASVTIFASVPAYAGTAVYSTDFSDVPKEHWAYSSVYQMRNMGITDGVGGGLFGLNEPVTRAQFAAFLCRLYRWETTSAGVSTFNDIRPSDWHFGFIEAAARHGTFIENSGNFRPDAPITRSEMAVMLVRSLGFGELAGQLTSSGFIDVFENSGYIALARDFGIIHGIDATRFAPNDTATRGHAAVMMMRMHSRQSSDIDFLNGFYAIRSADQMDYIPMLNSTCFGWSRFEMGSGSIVLNMTPANGNEFSLPVGYERPLEMANTALLMIAVKNEQINGINLTDFIISNETSRSHAINLIVDAIEKHPFDGVAIDFEEMRGESLKNNFTEFLSKLRVQIPDKLLYVAVHPVPRPGLPYFDAYDYAAIGNLADKVILMAHDYHTKRMTEQEMAMNFTITPLSPIDQVYYSLKAVTDENTGVKDRGKIVLQFSFEVVQWQSREGRVLNATPYTPTYDALVARMQSDGEINYSTRYESPYVTYTTDDGTHNTIWYEDARSVDAKIRLSKMFDINGFSLWRLGTVPEYHQEGFYLDVWSVVNARR